MKNFLLTVVLILFTQFSVSATLDNYSRLVASRANPSTRSDDQKATHYPAILQLESDATPLDEMVSDGIVLLHRRDEFALVYVPVSCLDRLDGYEGVRYVSISRPSIVNLDRARSMAGIDLIHDGAGELPEGFDGSGVVVGICDIGFDPSHPTFWTSDRSELRVRRVVQYSESTGRRLELNDPDEILAWQTDDADNNHATHVAGILAGADNTLGYGGVAPKADIVATVSELTDIGLLAGAEDIIAYARSVGRPAVINMSVGSYIGPHDGTSLFNQYLARLGREAIICLSAGNEGARPHVVDVTFGESRSETYSQIVGTDWVFFDLDGCVDIWSTDATPLETAIGIYDDPGRRIVYTRPYSTITEADGLQGISSMQIDIPGIEVDREFARLFTGAIYASAEVCPVNNRYNILYKVETSTEIHSSEGPWARYRPVIMVRGQSGQRAQLFADGIGTSFVNIAGGESRTTDWSVSDLACGDNMLCVGMYNSRTETPRLDGTVDSYRLNVGAVNQGSGYGTLLDGRVLPHVCAPGAMLISAMSRPYIEAHPSAVASMAASCEFNGNTCYWYSNGGTSMSSPFMAGIIAIWLQADPSLTIDNVKEILSKTNTPARLEPDDPRNGRGWVDPMAGLLAVIDNRAGVDNVTAAPSTGFKLADRRLSVVTIIAGRVDIYDYAGVRVQSFDAVAGHNEFNLAALGAGYYIATLGGSTFTFVLR